MKELTYPVVETIKKRRSVRTYQPRRIDADTIKLIEEYISQLSNPFGNDVHIHIAHKEISGEGEKLGTYGVIKGASTFLGVSVADSAHSLLAAGYEFEDLILYITSLGLGTVWLAATFTRDRFAKAMDIADSELFPAISPVGHAEKKRFLEKVMRKAVGADSRKPWSELFYDGDFATALTYEAADRYATALEMLRLAPSATNSQPWRVLKSGNKFLFYETHKPNAKVADVQIKQVDMGICLCHFVKTLEVEGIRGEISFEEPSLVQVPDNYHYVATWTAEDA